MTPLKRPDQISGGDSPLIPQVPVTVDTRGRVRVVKEQRTLILQEFARSGESAAAFARRTGLKYSTLAGWLLRYGRPKGSKRTQPLRFLEAVMDPPGSSAGGALALQLPGGIRVEVTDERQVVLAALLVRRLIQPC